MRNIDFQKAQMIKSSNMDKVDKIKELMKIPDFQFRYTDKDLFDLSDSKILKFTDKVFSVEAKLDGWNPLQKELAMKLNYTMFNRKKTKQYEKIKPEEFYENRDTIWDEELVKFESPYKKEDK